MKNVAMHPSWPFVLLLLGALLMPPPARAADCSGGVTTGVVTAPVLGNPTPLAWEGSYQEKQICFSSRQSGATLRGYLVAPTDIDTRSDALPLVVIAPGSLVGQESYYRWSARELASHGYLVLTEDPQGVGDSDPLGNPPCSTDGCPGVPPQQASNYMDGVASALDFAFARGADWLQKADLTHVGLAGHSLSARAISYLQGTDTRVNAIVAWDNLSSDLAGDAGSPSGGGTCGALIGGALPTGSMPVTPRVPAMGQASDSAGTCTPTDSDPEVKKTAYAQWRAAGVPAMEVVFSGANHLDWAQLTPTTDAASAKLERFEYYTRAWFDLFLKQDASATGRLLAPPSADASSSGGLSSKFCSAAFLPAANIDRADLVGGICTASAGTGAGTGESTSAGTGTGGGGFGRPQLLMLFLMAMFRASRRVVKPWCL